MDQRVVLQPGQTVLVPANVDFHVQVDRAMEVRFVFFRALCAGAVDLLTLVRPTRFVQETTTYAEQIMRIELLMQGESLSSRIRGVAVLANIVSDFFEGARPSQILDSSAELSRILPVIRYIDAHYRDPLAIEDLADIAAVSCSYLHAMFVSVMQITPLAYVGQRRLAEAKELLTLTEKSVKEIAFAVGYSDQFYFSRKFSKHEGVSPSEYRERFRSQPRQQQTGSDEIAKG